MVEFIVQVIRPQIEIYQLTLVPKISKTRHRTVSTGPRDAKKRLRKSPNIKPSMSSETQLRSSFKPLSSKDMEKIHRTALQVLQQIGMADPTPRIRDIALSGGCTLNQDNRLLFPSSLVEDMISCASKRFTVHGRDSKFDFELSSGTVNFCTGGAAVNMLDIESRDYRPSTLQDLYDLARLCDTLENIQWFTRPIVATDVEDLYQLDVNTVYACAAGTQKHIAGSITKGEHVHRLKHMLDLLSGTTGGFAKRPFFTVHATNIVSPLTFAHDSLDVACAAIDIGMPVHSQTGPQAGATAPAALAGTLVQGCAESLASLTVLNLLRPGHPIILGNWVFVSDLRTGAFSGGSGEQALLGAASGQMSDFYGIPGGMGACMTDSKVPDDQAGFEKALTTLTAALSGGGMVYEAAGMLASLLGCSHEAMVIDNEMLSSVHRIAKGIKVTDETLSFPVIRDTIDGPGHYLGHAQTMDLMEKEYVYPSLADRQTPAEWENSGGIDIWERAAFRAKEILSAHFPFYIDRESDAAIRQNYPIVLCPPSNKN